MSGGLIQCDLSSGSLRLTALLERDPRIKPGAVLQLKNHAREAQYE